VGDLFLSFAPFFKMCMLLIALPARIPRDPARGPDTDTMYVNNHEAANTFLSRSINASKRYAPFHEFLVRRQPHFARGVAL
jgi:hypothetical protein